MTTDVHVHVSKDQNVLVNVRHTLGDPNGNIKTDYASLVIGDVCFYMSPKQLSSVIDQLKEAYDQSLDKYNKQKEERGQSE